MAFLMVLLTGAIVFVVFIVCTAMAAKRGSETNIRITLVAGAIAAAMVWGWYFNWSSSPDRDREQAEKDCNNTTMAFVMSQNFVKQRLKAPSTAEFPYITDRGVMVDVIPDCSFGVSAYVDAQNAFGAAIRSRYTVKMSYDRASKMWRATELNIQ
ncbi:hypothetical protein [Pseudomonas extremaustralis]|uniref:Uncharacterized protein n=1 Tax=Pseudomonas extremaustralis TaxID=359110 RepID=A0A5C5QFN2_9PSED|nr:hypothetical protein [Pseudomonas extremaustralis]EZI28956.1 hypothetical protein PE143B_0109845 [Pseudomonas extremaustralis 14-3 substr. 14-3b]TWS04133.1 hypothetical protein FIV36_14395 [Pseudomonas extremaustralis]